MKTLLYIFLIIASLSPYSFLQGTMPTIRCSNGIAYTNLIFDNDSIVRANIFISSTPDSQMKLTWYLDQTTFGDSLYFTPSQYPPPMSDVLNIMAWELNYFDSVNNFKIHFQ